MSPPVLIILSVVATLAVSAAVLGIILWRQARQERRDRRSYSAGYADSSSVTFFDGLFIGSLISDMSFD